MKLKLEIEHLPEHLQECAANGLNHLQEIFDSIENMSREEIEGKVNMLSNHLLDVIKNHKIDV